MVLRMIVKQFYNKNQFLLDINGVRYLQSYESVVAKYYYDEEKNKRILVLGRDWNYSNTTRKHLYMFIDDCTSYYYLLNNTSNKRKAIQQAINNNIILYDENMY